jgi:hypothetical protein
MSVTGSDQEELKWKGMFQGKSPAEEHLQVVVAVLALVTHGDANTLSQEHAVLRESCRLLCCPGLGRVLLFCPPSQMPPH